jgi:hypothetical protein
MSKHYDQVVKDNKSALLPPDTQTPSGWTPKQESSNNTRISASFQVSGTDRRGIQRRQESGEKNLLGLISNHDILRIYYSIKNRGKGYQAVKIWYGFRAIFEICRFSYCKSFILGV